VGPKKKYKTALAQDKEGTLAIRVIGRDHKFRAILFCPFPFDGQLGPIKLQVGLVNVIRSRIFWKKKRVSLMDIAFPLEILKRSPILKPIGGTVLGESDGKESVWKEFWKISSKKLITQSGGFFFFWKKKNTFFKNV